MDLLHKQGLQCKVQQRFFIIELNTTICGLGNNKEYKENWVLHISLCYNVLQLEITPISCTSTMNMNLMWKDLLYFFDWILKIKTLNNMHLLHI